MTTVQPGQTIGGYTIINQVSTDGVINTFKAYSSALARDVLIKIIEPDADQRQALSKRFAVIADRLRNLKHPNIVSIQEVGESEGLFYLVTQELAASPLAERIKLGPLSLAEAAKVSGQVAEALDYAHDNGVVHGSLNPNNILVDSHGNAFLTDVGLVRTLFDQAANLEPYLSPEQQRSAQYDKRADIFALGRTLYAMLTGREQDSEAESLADVIRRQVDSSAIPSALKPAATSIIQDLIERATARIPAERFETAREFVEAWEQIRQTHRAATSSTASSSVNSVSPIVLERGRAQAEVRERRTMEEQTVLTTSQRMEMEARVRQETLEREAKLKQNQFEAEARAQRERMEREIAEARKKSEEENRRIQAEIERAKSEARQTSEAAKTAAHEAAHGSGGKSAAHTTAHGEQTREEILNAARAAQTQVEQRLQAEKERSVRASAEAKQKAQQTMGAALNKEQAERLQKAREEAQRKGKSQAKQQAKQTAKGAASAPVAKPINVAPPAPRAPTGQQRTPDLDAGKLAAGAGRLFRRIIGGAAAFWVLCVGCIVLASLFGDDSSTSEPTPTRTPIVRATATNSIVQLALTASALTRVAATTQATRVATTTSTATRVITQTTPTPRLSPTPFAGTLVFSDTFQSGDCKLSEGDNDRRTVKCENGEYIVLNKNTTERWFYYSDQQLSDLMLEVEGRVISATGTAEYGVVFRVGDDGQSMYGLTVAQNGRISIFRYQNDTFTNILPNSTMTVNPTGKNKLRVTAVGSRLTFSVNDRTELTVTDRTFTRGAFGLIIRNTQPNAQVGFSNLRVFTPADVSTPAPSPTR